MQPKHLNLRLYIPVFIYCLLLQHYANSQFVHPDDSIKNNTKAFTIKPVINLKNLQLDTVPAHMFQQATLSAVPTVNHFKNRFADSLKRFRSIANNLKELYKNPVRFGGGQIEFFGVADSSYINGATSAYLGNFNLQSDWTIAGIPATINAASQSWSEFSNDKNWASVKFDKDNYLNSIKKKLTGKFDPASLLEMSVDAVQQMVDEAKKDLFSDLTSLNNKYKGAISIELLGFKGVQNLSTIELTNLRQQLLKPEFIKDILAKENLLGLFQQKLNTGGKINEAEFVQLQQEVMKMKAIQELITKVEEHKSKWESTGLLRKIKDSELLRKEKLVQLAKDPATIRKMAKEHLSLKGLERLFLNVNRFDMGQNALSLSPMSFRSYLNNGVVSEFLNNKGKSILLLLGKQKDLNSILDYNFEANLFSNTGVAKAARLELGKTKKSTSHIALSSFNQSLFNTLTPFNAADFRKIMVTTISNEFLLGEKGQLYFDLSRSATQYQNPAINTDSTLVTKNALSGLFSGENLMDNTAITIKYSDEFPLKGLSYQVNFNKVANGYSNPGNSFLSNGSTEFGFNLRKSFLKNKFQVSIRANGREYKFNEHDNRKWRNSYLVLDTRMKMKKGQYVSVRYQPHKMVRIVGVSRHIASSIERLSLDANLYKRFNKTAYRNLISLSYLANSYDFLQSTSRTRSFQVNSVQSISLGKNLLFINTNYTSSNNQSGFVYLNTSLLTEAGYTYQLFRKLSASSGITYNGIEGWFKQLGIRQTLSGELGKKFSVNIYIDARKNLVVYQALWNQPIRADIALRYILGRNE